MQKLIGILDLYLLFDLLIQSSILFHIQGATERCWRTYTPIINNYKYSVSHLQTAPNELESRHDVPGGGQTAERREHEADTCRPHQGLASAASVGEVAPGEREQNTSRWWNKVGHSNF